MWFFGLSAINLLWNFHKSMLDRCLCLGLTGNRLVIFEIFLEQLQNLVFSTFFHISFLHLLLFLSIFCFLFFVSEVLILSLEVCRLILHLLMISDIVTPKFSSCVFFLIFFAQNAHFFLMLGIDFLCKMWNKMFWRDKKKFHNPVILFLFWIVSFHYHFFSKSKKTNFRISLVVLDFFHSFSFFYFVGGNFVFLGIFFCMWGEEVFFIIHKQIFDDFSIFLYIFFYIGIFFLEALLENNPRKKSCFCSSFLSNFRPGWSWVFFVFVLIFFDFSWLVFK